MENTAEVSRSFVIDKHTGRVVSSAYKSVYRARARADKLDLEYGAVRYYVKTESTKVRIEA